MIDFANLQYNEISEIAIKFSLEGRLNFEILKGGQVNFNYLVERGEEKYVATIFHPIKNENLHNLIAILLLLQEKNFPSSKLVETIMGGFICQFKDRYVMIKEYIEGETIKNLDANKLTKVGEAIAKLNEIEYHDFIPIEYPYGIKYFDEVANSKDEFSKWLSAKKEKISENISNKLPQGFIHGDVFWDNILWNKNKIAGIIDFDEACWYYKIFDIAKAIVGNCIENEKINFEKAKALVKGYEKIRKLQNIEKKKIQLFVEYAAVGTSFLRYKLKRTIPEEKSRDYREMIRIAENINEINKDYFIERIF